MTTPDETKRALDTCTELVMPKEVQHQAMLDALAYIQQLEAENEAYKHAARKCCYESRCNAQIKELETLGRRLMDEKKQLERERDAAVGELIGCCFVCRWEETEKCATCHFNAESWNVHESNWEWRGVKEE